MPTADELRAQADALDRFEEIEAEAREAKDAYRAAPGDPAAKARHRAASKALNDARAVARGDRPLVGGDAVADPEEG
jgi:vacuolar-type H+-ATPase subunit E/Vma4